MTEDKQDIPEQSDTTQSQASTVEQAVCPYCGNAITPGDQRCSHCGAWLRHFSGLEWNVLRISGTAFAIFICFWILTFPFNFLVAAFFTSMIIRLGCLISSVLYVIYYIIFYESWFALYDHPSPEGILYLYGAGILILFVKRFWGKLMKFRAAASPWMKRLSLAISTGMACYVLWIMISNSVIPANHRWDIMKWREYRVLSHFFGIPLPPSFRLTQVDDDSGFAPDGAPVQYFISLDARDIDSLININNKKVNRVDDDGSKYVQSWFGENPSKQIKMYEIGENRRTSRMVVDEESSPTLKIYLSAWLY